MAAKKTVTENQEELKAAAKAVAKATKKPAAKAKEETKEKEAPAKKSISDIINEEKEAAEAVLDETSAADEEDSVKEVPSGNRKPITSEVAKAFEEATAQEDMFLRRSIVLPENKRKIRKAFKSEEIIGDEDGEIMTEGRQREMEYQLLSDSAKSQRPKILTGRITGIEAVEIGNSRTYEAKVSLIANPRDENIRALMRVGKEPASIYSIYIPAPMLFFYRNPARYEGEEGQNHLFKDMKSRIGSIIDFVVYRVSPDDDRVIGSRIRAMQLKSQQYYLNPRTKKVEPGSICKARVTSVGVLGIFADVLGAECFIANEELSWQHFNAALDEYDVGDLIKVKVKTIETDKSVIYGREYSYVSITASVRDAEPRPIDKYGAKFTIGSTYDGVVTYRHQTGLYYVRLSNQIDCVCKPPAFNTPHIGQKCSVVITDKTKDGIRGNFSYLGR